jgi:hypothetical protein
MARKKSERRQYLARIAFEGSASIHEVTEEDGMIVAVGPIWRSKAATVAELLHDLNALVDLIGDATAAFDTDRDADMFADEAREQYFQLTF